jgi:asparagine synthase (glutamine-hydrolysing)
LGQCALRTTPDSARDRQPRLSQSANIILVSDARVDNRAELINELKITDRPQLEVADSLIIMRAYQRWGELSPEKIVGDFAFALWDADQRHLFCARDAIGVRPFYYLLSASCFAFASEIKAIKTLAQFSACINEQKVADYLLWSFDDLEATFYRDVRKLKPAHSLTVNTDKASPRRYWNLDPQREIHMNSQSAYVEAFQELFTDAVRVRMRCADPVGSTLSGGLDSSAIACTAQRLQNQIHEKKMTVVSAIFSALPGPELAQVDEHRYIHAVTDRGGFKHVVVHPDEYNPLLDPSELYTILDEPFFAPTQFLFWAIYRGARDAGLRVLLDGTDGDSTVSHGESYLADLVHSFRWYSAYHSAAELAAVQGNSLRSTLWAHGVAPALPGGLVRAVRKVRGDQREYWSGEGLLDVSFLNHLQLPPDKVRFQGDGYKRYVSSRQKHYDELASPLIPLALELFDVLAAKHGLEVRYPFFDRRMIEFCLALPQNLKFDQGWSRYVLRAAMEGILPSEVQWRTSKANLPVAFARQMMAYERPRLDQSIMGSETFLPGVIDPSVLQSAYRRCREDPVRYLTETYMVFGAANLDNWIKTSNVQF